MTVVHRDLVPYIDVLYPNPDGSKNIQAPYTSMTSQYDCPFSLESATRVLLRSVDYTVDRQVNIKSNAIYRVFSNSLPPEIIVRPKHPPVSCAQ